MTYKHGPETLTLTWDGGGWLVAKRSTSVKCASVIIQVKDGESCTAVEKRATKRVNKIWKRMFTATAEAIPCP